MSKTIQAVVLAMAWSWTVSGSTADTSGVLSTNLLPKAPPQPSLAVTNQSHGLLADWLSSLGVDSNRIEHTILSGELEKMQHLFSEWNVNTNQVMHLLNGKNLNAFYTWLEKDGVYRDKDRVFSVTNGWLRISGQHNGYLATKNSFADYRLVAEFKWGTMIWGANKNRLRNSGLCIHGTGLDKIWMKSIECQIAERQTGDTVLLDGAKLAVNGIIQSRPWHTFKRNLTEEQLNAARAKDGDALEKPVGEWNIIELICQGGMLKVLINGKPVLEGSSAWPSAGRILLQSNGAEIFFRRLDVYPLNAQ
jgi:hypothetical protein